MIAAPERQRRRSPLPNAVLPPLALERAAELDDESRRLISRAVEQLGLSARAYGKVLKVARTIADLDRALDDVGQRQTLLEQPGDPEPGDRELLGEVRQDRPVRAHSSLQVDANNVDRRTWDADLLVTGCVGTTRYSGVRPSATSGDELADGR